jgi:DNA-binding transcriptional regulator LsrR (DeoR family)
MIASKKKLDNISSDYFKVAYYYYEGGFTQKQIADKLMMSRQRVNRILKKCLELGIVKITIEPYKKRNIDLESAFEMKYNLKEAIIIDSESDDEPNVAAGNYIGELLSRIVNDNSVIGCSKGKALSVAVKYLQPIDKDNIITTQLVGSLSNGEGINSNNIVKTAANTIGATPHFMYAPFFMSDETVLKALMKDESFKENFKYMKKCDIAMVGIAEIDRFYKEDMYEFIPKGDIELLKKNKAIGEICTHFYNQDGEIINTSLDVHAVTINTDIYKNINYKIGIGCEKSKAKAILGAVNGGLINILVTTTETAEEMMRLDK